MPLVVVLPFLVDLVAEQRVLAIRLDADVGPQQAVDRHRVRGGDARERRVRAAERLPVRKRVGDGDRRVVQPQHLPLVAQELAREDVDRNATLGSSDQLDG